MNPRRSLVFRKKINNKKLSNYFRSLDSARMDVHSQILHLLTAFSWDFFASYYTCLPYKSLSSFTSLPYQMEPAKEGKGKENTY